MTTTPLDAAPLTTMEQRVLALAGLVQALKQVRQIAETGQADAGVVATAIDSMFRIDAESPQAIYGGTSQLRPGLLLMRAYFSNQGGDEMLPRLALAVFQLERRFVRDAIVAQQVHDGVIAVLPVAERLGQHHPEVLAALGALYADTVSHLRPRVLVQGNPHYLGQASVVAEIRAMLLAALRSAVLWRQLDGSLWDFLLRRRELMQAIGTHLD
jgi:high frequency lysogenization protein